MAAALEDLTDDILLQIFGRLDGPSLASVGIVSSHLRRLSTLPSLWLNLCISTYPSLLLLLPSLQFSPHTFFSRAYSLPQFPSSSAAPSKPFPNIVSSFVDLRHRGALILSRVISTDTGSASFLQSKFRLDAIEGHMRPEPGFSPRELELSWVMADRRGDRAVGLSRGKPVSIERNWFSGDVTVRFVTEVGEGRAAVVAAVVVCSVVGVRKVGLVVEDGDGIEMNGRDGMVVIGKMMDSYRGVGGRGCRGGLIFN